MVEARLRAITEDLEQAGILLSQYGNHNARGSMVKPERYWELKAAGGLFDPEKVGMAVRLIPRLFVEKVGGRYAGTSYALKHAFTDFIGHVAEVDKHPYVTNGDFIAACIILGYKVNFGRGKKSVNPRLRLFVSRRAAHTMKNKGVRYFQ